MAFQHLGGRKSTDSNYPSHIVPMKMIFQKGLCAFYEFSVSCGGVLRLPKITFSLLNVIQTLVCPGGSVSDGVNCCDWEFNAVKGSFGQDKSGLFPTQMWRLPVVRAHIPKSTRWCCGDIRRENSFYMKPLTTDLNSLFSRYISIWGKEFKMHNNFHFFSLNANI